MKIEQKINYELINKTVLVIGFVIAILQFLLTKNKDLVATISLVALIAGFLNIYFTTERSTLFIVFDMIWIACSIVLLAFTQNFSDIWLYIFYIGIGFYQFYNWNKHTDDEGKAELIYPSEIPTETWYWVLAAVIVTFIIINFYLFTGIESANLIIGSIVSGFGIVASIMLAKRQYFSYLLYFFGNGLQLYLYVVSGLFALSLIPLVYFIFTCLFLIENRKK